MLPQGQAYNSLLNRLKHIEVLSILDTSKPELRNNSQ